jgi:hypothetical protein
MARGTARLDEPIRFDEHGNPTATRRDVILAGTRRGLPADIAIQAARIPMRTFRLWLSTGRDVYARTIDEPDAELTDEERALAQFATDVDAAIGEWFESANAILEAHTTDGVTVTTTKEVIVAGEGDEDVIERTVTTRHTPGDMATLMWRMGKLAPTVYGTSRVELTGADGGAVQVDIGERLAEAIASIRASLSVDPAESNGHGG